MPGARKPYAGILLGIRSACRDTVKVSAELLRDGGRPVEIFLSRNRLESMIIDLIDDGAIFSTDDVVSELSRKKLLAMIGKGGK